MSKILALEYAEKVKKVNKGVIDAFEAGYKRKEKEYESLNYTYHLNRAKGLLLKQIEDNNKQAENIKLGIGYNDLRGTAYEREMDKIKSIISENTVLKNKIALISDLLNNIK